MKFFRLPARASAPVDDTREELLAQNVRLVTTLQGLIETVNYLRPIEKASRSFIELCGTLGANGKAIFTITDDEDGMGDAAVNAVIDIATALDGVEPPMHVFQTDRSIH